MSGETLGPGPQEMGLRPEDVQIEKSSQEGEVAFEIEKVGGKESREVMSKVEIEADPFNGQKLTREYLEDQGLAPAHKTTVGGRDFYLSPAYNLGRGRIGLVAYVEKEEGFVARSYYQSSSHGLWRYLPDYIPVEDKIRFYGKGYGSSESVTLPIVLQRALASLSQEQGNLVEVDKPDFVFAGTAFKMGEKGDYYQEVEKTPKLLEGNFYPPQGQKIPPEQLKFTNPENAPDFSTPLASWQQKSNLYGQVTIEVFPSRDGQFKFLFCKDSAGRAWVGGVETESEVGSIGLRREWVDGGDLTTPAFEYKDQAGIYGNIEDMRGEYVDMFTNYLSKVPIIQEYLHFH